MDSKKELGSLMALQREDGKHHKTYEDELKFYELVKNGDLDAIRSYSKLYLTDDQKDYGKLSPNPIRNLTYHLVILAAMLTRFSVEGGMPEETAYSLSDLYIRAVDRLHTSKEIQALHQKMILDYTTRMHEIKKQNYYPKTIVLCIDYINDHLNERITVKELASLTNKNASYLCKLFKKETGHSVSSYITNTKILAAMEQLRYTDLSCLEIASDFGFASQSHFTKVFHQITGLTPHAYRNKYFRSNFTL